MTTALFGGDDPDTLTALNGEDCILRGYGGDGDDRMVSRAGDYSLSGGVGDDDFTLTGPGQVTAAGGGGDGANLIYGGENADTVYGGAGNDTLNAVVGTGGDPGLESLFGGLGHDEILGGNSAIGTEFHGDEGNDTLISGALIGDGDQYFGGIGRDQAHFGAATGSLRVWIGDSGTADLAGVVHAFSSIENVVLTGFDDFAQGNGAANRIEGGNGNDSIYAGGGDDSVYGGAGTDYIEDAAGLAQIFGGSGDDMIFLAGVTATGGLADGGSGSNDLIGTGDNTTGWQIDLAAGTAAAAGRVHGISGFEAAAGGMRDDSLIGDAGANRLYGSDGADRRQRARHVVWRGGCGPRKAPAPPPMRGSTPAAPPWPPPGPRCCPAR